MRLTTLILSILLFLPLAAIGEKPSLPPGTGVPVPRDASSTNIPTTYTTNAGVVGLTALVGKSRILVINNTATDIGVCTTSAVANCVGGSDNLQIPAGQGQVLENFSVNTHVCVRSLGSTISSGKVWFNVW